MNMLDNMVGALSKSNSKSVIYFCIYTETDFEKSAIDKLLRTVEHSLNLDGNDIRFLAVESTDEMEEDCRLVGLIYEHEDVVKSIVLDTYEDLDVYLREIAE